MDQSICSGLEIHAPPAKGRMIITALGIAQIFAWGRTYEEKAGGQRASGFR